MLDPAISERNPAALLPRHWKGGCRALPPPRQLGDPFPLAFGREQVADSVREPGDVLAIGVEDPSAGKLERADRIEGRELIAREP